MAVVAKHQLAQTVTCHAWNADRTSESTPIMLSLLRFLLDVGICHRPYRLGRDPERLVCLIEFHYCESSDVGVPS